MTSWGPWIFWAVSYCLALATASFTVVEFQRSSVRSSLFGHLVPAVICFSRFCLCSRHLLVSGILKRTLRQIGLSPVRGLSA